MSSLSQNNQPRPAGGYKFKFEFGVHCQRTKFLFPFVSQSKIILIKMNQNFTFDLRQLTKGNPTGNIVVSVLRLRYLKQKIFLSC